jgi:hypothetical protein
MNMDDRYEMTKIAGYTKILSDTRTFAYEIKQLDPLTQTLSLNITSGSFSIHYTENVANYDLLSMIFFGYIILFFHTLHGKCSDL